MIRVRRRQQLICVASCCAFLRHCSAVAHPLTVRENAVKFLEQLKACKMLKSDRALLAALHSDQYKVEELRATVWTSTSTPVIHGVGHRRAKVVKGVPYPYTSENETAKDQVTHSVNDVLVGGTPFIASDDVQRGVMRHVGSREWSDPDTKRISLWCNSGIAGSGKSTLLAHSAAAAVLELEAMVREAVGKDEAAVWLHRPLGFLVTFNTLATPQSDDDAFGTSHILTRIALRMLYSLCGAGKPESLSELEALLDDMTEVRGARRKMIATQQSRTGVSVSFWKFLDPYLASARLNEDKENFDAIVAAMREVLEWEGPLFLAVDEFAKPFETGEDKDAKTKALTTALVGLCHHVLDASLPLKLSGGRLLYSQYGIVSVYHGVNLMKVTTLSNRKLITQPMPAISVVELLRRYAQMSNTLIERLQLPTMYSQLLDPSHRLKPLSIEQYLFLAEIALTRGHPREVQRVIKAYTEPTERGRFAVPIAADVVKFTGASNDVRLAACRLVAGLHDVGIFDDGSEDARALPFWNDATQRQCKFTSAVPPRVLTSPQFLRSVAAGWIPATWSDFWIVHHMRKLAKSLEAQTSSDRRLVSIGALVLGASNANENIEGDGNAKAGEHAVAADGRHKDVEPVLHAGHKQGGIEAGCSVSHKVTKLWLRAANVHFEELTFYALTVRLACLLHAGTKEDEEQAAFMAKMMEGQISAKKAKIWSKLKISSVKTDTRLLVNILKGVGRDLPEETSRGLKHVRLRAGAIREIDVRNFPSMFNDIYCVPDAGFRTDMSSAAKEDMKRVANEHGEAGKSICELSKGFLATIFSDDGDFELSVKAVQAALACDDHFCFRPSNPDNHGEDSVIFLRVDKPSSECVKSNKPNPKSKEPIPDWIVLLLQNKQSLNNERGNGESVVKSTRNLTEHLFHALSDSEKKTHSFMYVRALVTVNPIDKKFFFNKPHKHLVT